VDILRIADLLAIDALGTTLLAGGDGVDRKVLWAHSCELEYPDRWLGEDELLMTVGLGIPAAQDAQIDLIRRLDAKGLAGLAVGDDEVAPPLSAGMLREADARGFPILLTAHSVPFAAIGRTVAAANSSNQAQQVLTLNRLYHSLLEIGDGSDLFLTLLGKIFNVKMVAIDQETGEAVLAGPLHVEREEISALLGRGQNKTDHMVKVDAIPQRGISAWRVPAQRATVLLIDETEALMLDSFTVVHLGRAVSIEVDRVTDRQLARDNKLGHIIATVLAGDSNPGRLQPEAVDLGLDVENLVILVTHADSSSEPTSTALTLAGIAHGAVTRNDYLTICLNQSDLDRARHMMSRLATRTGASRRFAGLAEVQEALLNAQWALESITGVDSMTIDYDDATFSLMPRSPGEAHEIVRRVLGPLTEHTSGSTMLLDTLCAFLDEDRNWAATAERLGIHRQTLAYRLKQIEKATGRSLKRTRDVAELWIARTALRLL